MGYNSRALAPPKARQMQPLGEVLQNPALEQNGGEAQTENSLGPSLTVDEKFSQPLPQSNNPVNLPPMRPPLDNQGNPISL